MVPIFTVLGAASMSFVIDGRIWDFMPGWRVEDMPDQTGKVAIVTGPTLGGIGYESCLELARKGAHVIMAGRSKSKGEEALRALHAELPQAKAEFQQLDLASLESVKQFADSFLARSLPLNILINNAGVMMNPFTITPDGFESQFATNHLGHHLLTRLLMPALQKAAPGRIVTVSSAAAYFPDVFAALSKVAPERWMSATMSKPLDYSENLRSDHEPHYNPTEAYGRSKLANVLFARALDRRVLSKRIFSNSCNPGAIKTNLPRHVKSNVRERFGQMLESFLDAMSTPLMLTPKQGAVTQLFLATATEVETQNIHGQYYRPQAIPAPLPTSVSDYLEEHLWQVSENLLAKYL
eukprot:CAMPEP_0115173702 /NCGR_PEP_ID=MMETSP0270-20121206/3460_1 /TAXON_ID=71861 /ORGANISM="Scrippsiella trochoidea, Strain CCMP3099" /LENGTH=351 /DNA_ID=CAMNT_0002586519 /DNA_START=15 /DNA_END=1070 /DNA_ORIENTATION=-